MKKFVKPLVIAASVAAIAGVGAVSFAAWSAGTNNTKTTNANATGEISVLEFGTTTPAAVTGLLPIDQNGIATPEYKTVTFQIKTSEGYDKSDFKLNVKIDNMKDSSNADASLASGSGIYVSKTAPTAVVTGDTGKVVAAGVDVTYDLTDASSGTYTLYVWLQSDDTADMNHTFDLVYTLADGTTAA